MKKALWLALLLIGPAAWATCSSNPVLITTYGGAVGDGTTDNTTAIQNTFNYANTNGCGVEIPAGTFAYSNVLTMNSIAVFGLGSTSILKATSATNSAVKLTGTAPSLTNLVILGTGSTRNTGQNQSDIWVSSATGYTISNVLMSGGSCTGIWNQSGSTGTETNNTVHDTLADSITNTNGANHITETNNLVYNSGDDGYSNNSYTGDGNTVNNITINQNAFMAGGKARGMECSGCDHVTFSNNYIDNNSGYADLILASETSSFTTQAVTNVTVTGNTLVRGGPNQGALFFWPDGSSNTLSGITVNGNQWYNTTTFTAVQVTGAGTLTSVLVENSNAYITPGPSFFSSSFTGTGSVTQTSNTTHTTASYPGAIAPPVGGTVPIFSVPAGSYPSSQSLTLAEVTSGDAITYCTTTGSSCTPVTSYSGAITVASTGSVCALGTNSAPTTPVPSATICTAYTISGTAATPTFSPVAGTYAGTQNVAISTTSPGAVICYNTTGSPATNGSSGCTAGTLYTGLVSVAASETLFAVAGATGFSDSTISSAAYTITAPTAIVKVTGKIGMTGTVSIQ